MHTKNVKSYWPKIAENWKKVTPPVRPSKEDIKIYDSFLKSALKNKNNPKILVLGSTPELRDLVSGYGAEITVADLSAEMMMAMAGLMKYEEKTKDEIWIKGDWSNIPLAENYFDAIIGDAVSTNVPWDKAKLWSKHTASLLKKDGVFVERAFIYTDRENIIKRINELFKLIAAKKIDFNQALSIFQNLLVSLSYDKSKIVINSKNKENILKFKADYGNKFINNLYGKFDKLFPSSPPKLWRSLTEKEQTDEYGNNFKIIKKVPSKSLIQNFVFYLLKKK